MRKKKRVEKRERAVVGLSLDEINKIRNERPEVRQAKTEEALREIKARKQKLLDQKKVTQKARQQDGGAKKAAEKKQQKNTQKPVAKGGKR